MRPHRRQTGSTQRVGNAWHKDCCGQEAAVTSVRLLAVSVLWLPAAPTAFSHAQAVEPPCGAAERLGYTVARVTELGVPADIDVPVHKGDTVSVDVFNRIRDTIAKHFDERDEGGAYRFRYQAVTVTCENANPADATIDIEFRADSVAIPVGDSAGNVIDEANVDRLDVLRNESSIAARWNRDERLGNVLGFLLQESL